MVALNKDNNRNMDRDDLVHPKTKEDHEKRMKKVVSVLDEAVKIYGEDAFDALMTEFHHSIPNATTEGALIQLFISTSMVVWYSMKKIEEFEKE